MDGQLAYRPADACKVLGLGRSTLFELMRTGEIKSVRVGAIRLITRDALNEWLDRLAQQQ